MARIVRERSRERHTAVTRRRQPVSEARASEGRFEQRRANALLLGQKRVLERIALGAPLGETLDALLRVVESEAPQLLASILLLDKDGVHVRHGAGPRLSERFKQAIDGSPIGPKAGSCGTAAHRKESVIVADIASDPLWADYKELALSEGLRACWSTPIFDAQRNVLGTFALYFKKPGKPTDDHLALIDMATQTAAIAITRKREEEAHAQAEEMLRQSQKLESVGRLAGGVAHDFNNILSVIVGYGELMRRQIGEDHAAWPRLEQVIKAATRGAGLTRQLLAFSRKQVMQPRPLDLGASVDDMRKMFDRVVGADVEIVVRNAKPLGAVLADPTQIEQVILNLVVNARDAMPEGGRLTIETANADFDETYASGHPPAQPGRFVMLAVSDTGIGMDAETQARIFEPFFTTKAPGEGTGLGLATVYGIVKQMGGFIWVYSEVGQGTSFKIYLPRIDEAVAAGTKPGSAEPIPRGHETVLVVEDSESVRNLVRELLTQQGYTVLAVTQGEEALAFLEKEKRSVDLVLTDVVMPKLGGAELVKRLRAIYPRLRAVYMSGYTDGAISKHGVLDADAILLEKPFTAESLARTIRRALDR